MGKEVIDEEMNVVENHLSGKKVLEEMFNNYNLARETNKYKKGNDNWYEFCGIVMRKMAEETDIIPADTLEERIEILEGFLIEHIVDSLMMDEKIHFMNYIYSNKDLEITLEQMDLKFFFRKAKQYLLSKIIVSNNITGIVLFNGPSRIDNLNIFILKNNKWIFAEPEDIKDLKKGIDNKYKLKTNLNRYVGFIGFETNNKYMVYQVKDTENERSTGFRCDQAGKNKIMKILNEIEVGDRYKSKETKDNSKELCVRQELTLRSFERQKLDNATWFLDTETAIINEFQKKEKKKK
jgi:hypothetical protein